MVRPEPSGPGCETQVTVGPFTIDTAKPVTLSLPTGKLPQIAGMPVIGGKAKIGVRP